MFIYLCFITDTIYIFPCSRNLAPAPLLRLATRQNTSSANCRSSPLSHRFGHWGTNILYPPAENSATFVLFPSAKLAIISYISSTCAVFLCKINRGSSYIEHCFWRIGNLHPFAASTRHCSNRTPIAHRPLSASLAIAMLLQNKSYVITR